MASTVNQTGLCANAVFLEHYLDCQESLPEDVQKNVSQLRELDLLYRAKLEQIDHLIKLYLAEKDSVLKSNYLVKIQRCLVRSQEYGDEKLQLISQIVEVAENKNHQIANDAENVEIVSRGADEVSSTRTESPVPRPEEPRNHEKLKRPRRQKTTEKEEKEKENNKEKEVIKEKKSKRTENDKSEKTDLPTGPAANTNSSSESCKKVMKKKTKTTKKKKKESVRDVIDPNEPTYCLCQQVSYGEMIGCDNEECPIEWFHFRCVNLTVKPKGKWYCPGCLSERKEKGKK